MLTEEQKKKIKLEEERIAANIQQFNHRIAVFSGKGGVGKTTVSVNIAYGLQLLDLKSGILDADVTGPNVPKMLGLNETPSFFDNRFLPHKVNGVEIMSLANLVPKNQPILWRGPMRSKLINQFLADAEWGQLDYLIADLPPGTGDEIMTIAQQMKPDLAIIVTTPQEMSLIDSARAVNMAKEIKIPKIGLIENMSGMVCPECGSKIDLFGSGGGLKQARDMGVVFLGALPIDINARELADKGQPIITANIEADISQQFLAVVKNVVRLFEEAPSHILIQNLERETN